MALTREFRETVAARVRRDRRFREALFAEALRACLEGDLATGKSMLRDLVNSTVGFEELARATGKPSKSLHRMLGARGNPRSDTFFEIVRVLQRKTRVRLAVRAASRPSASRPPAA